MDLAAIIAQARIWTDDRLEPYLVEDDDYIPWGNEAQFEAAIRMRLLVDSSTTAVCQIPLVAGQGLYSLHQKVIVARRIEFQPADATQRACVLERTTFDALDRRDPYWTSATGRPNAVVQDLQQRKLRLDRLPTADTLGTLLLTAWRKPLDKEQLEQVGDEPVIPEEWHLPLAHWLCYRTYGIADAEIRSVDKQAEHLAQFEATFGPRPTAAQLRALATDDAGEVVPHWF